MVERTVVTPEEMAGDQASEGIAGALQQEAAGCEVSAEADPRVLDLLGGVLAQDVHGPQQVGGATGVVLEATALEAGVGARVGLGGLDALGVQLDPQDLESGGYATEALGALEGGARHSAVAQVDEEGTGLALQQPRLGGTDEDVQAPEPVGRRLSTCGTSLRPGHGGL